MKKRQFSDILARMQGGIDNLSGVVSTKDVEKVLGKDFVCESGEGYRITFRRFKDDSTKGYFTFEKVSD